MMNTQKAYDEIRRLAHDYDNAQETANLDLDLIKLDLELDELNWVMEEAYEPLPALRSTSYCRRPF